MIGVAASGEPDSEAAGNDHKHGGAKEDAAPASHDQSTEDKKGNRIGNEVGKVTVQEGRECDAAKSGESSWADAPTLEVKHRYQVIDDFNQPHGGQHAEQENGVVTQDAE